MKNIYLGYYKGIDNAELIVVVTSTSSGFGARKIPARQRDVRWESMRECVQNSLWNSKEVRYDR